MHMIKGLKAGLKMKLIFIAFWLSLVKTHLSKKREYNKDLLKYWWSNCLNNVKIRCRWNGIDTIKSIEINLDGK